MSVGRISSFLDIYIERDLEEGTLEESGAQELWDQLVQKLRIVRFLRTPDYDALFSGDPYWATECVGGMDLDGRALVTKSSYRMLHTLYNLGPAPVLGGRLRHRLLCLGHASRQADAVLRRPRQSRKGAALRDQWRPRRNIRRASRAPDAPGHG